MTQIVKVGTPLLPDQYHFYRSKHHRKNCSPSPHLIPPLIPPIQSSSLHIIPCRTTLHTCIDIASTQQNDLKPQTTPTRTTSPAVLHPPLGAPADQKLSKELPCPPSPPRYTAYPTRPPMQLSTPLTPGPGKTDGPLGQVQSGAQTPPTTAPSAPTSVTRPPPQL